MVPCPIACNNYLTLWHLYLSERNRALAFFKLLLNHLFNSITNSFNKLLWKQFILLIGYPLSPINFRPVTRTGINLNSSGRMNIGHERIRNIINHFSVQVECLDLSQISEFLIPEPDSKLIFHSIKLLNIKARCASSRYYLLRTEVIVAGTISMTQNKRIQNEKQCYPIRTTG